MRTNQLARLEQVEVRGGPARRGLPKAAFGLLPGSPRRRAPGVGFGAAPGPLAVPTHPPETGRVSW